MIRCQKCSTVNPLTEKTCVRCGTPLMIISSPAVARFEAESSAGVECDIEYLLEHISTLENRLLRVADQIERILDVVVRHVRNSQTDHLMLQSLVVVLSETGALDAEQFERLLRARVEAELENEKEKGENAEGEAEDDIVSSDGDERVH